MRKTSKIGFPIFTVEFTAEATVLQNIYEQDFLGFSYGFRPQRGPHDALDALAYAIYEERVNWVLDADIQGFFDEIDRNSLGGVRPTIGGATRARGSRQMRDVRFSRVHPHLW